MQEMHATIQGRGNVNECANRLSNYW